MATNISKGLSQGTLEKSHFNAEFCARKYEHCQKTRRFFQRSFKRKKENKTRDVNGSTSKVAENSERRKLSSR